MKISEMVSNLKENGLLLSKVKIDDLYTAAIATENLNSELQQQANALAILAEERRILIVNIESTKAQWMAEGAHQVAVAIKACEEEFPQASLDIVQECALIADNIADKLRAGEVSK